jgi:hypothetical protein
MNTLLELEGFGTDKSPLGAPNLTALLQQMIQQRPAVSSGGVTLSVTEAGNVVALLNRRVESAREGLNTVQVDVLLQNCEVLTDTLACSAPSQTTSISISMIVSRTPFARRRSCH